MLLSMVDFIVQAFLHNVRQFATQRLRIFGPPIKMCSMYKVNWQKNYIS